MSSSSSSDSKESKLEAPTPPKNSQDLRASSALQPPPKTEATAPPGLLLNAPSSLLQSVSDENGVLQVLQGMKIVIFEAEMTTLADRRIRKVPGADNTFVMFSRAVQNSIAVSKNSDKLSELVLEVRDHEAARERSHTTLEERVEKASDVLKHIS